MEQQFFIYKIVNTTNNKIYIGQTIDPKSRWATHKSDAKYRRHKNTYLYNAIHKYGENNFTFEVIASCLGIDNANALEITIIKQYNSTDKNIGYNILAGGNNALLTDDIKKQISKTLKKGRAFNKFSIEQEKKIVEDYLSGLDTVQISKQFNCSHKTIRSIVIRSGHKVRGRSGHKPGTFRHSNASKKKLSKALTGKASSNKGKPSPKRTPPELEKSIYNDYRQIKSFRLVANKYNKNPKVISRIVKRYEEENNNVRNNNKSSHTSTSN